MKRNKIIAVLTILLYGFSYGKELFTEKTIKNFLNKENPYIYSLLGEIFVYEGKLKYYRGFFDTKLSGKYEKKEYPLSEGLFYSFSIEKPTISGIDLSFGYRKATGVQEYNNIKTGEDGELILGLKIPVFNLTRNIDERRLNLFLTTIDIRKLEYKYQDNIRKLYLKIISSYYKTLYFKELVELEKQLLQKAQKRKEFIIKKIKEGLLPTIYQVEVEQQIINRRQRLTEAKNNFKTQLNEFLKFLNLDEKDFNSMYELPSLPPLPELNISLEEALKTAIENRPDLKVIETEKNRLETEKIFYSLLKYPKFDISIYGTHDLKYNNGYKVLLNATFPLERRKYIGKTIELKKSSILLDKRQEKILIEIKTNLKNILNTLKTIRKNIKMSEKEITLAKELEKAEVKKFEVGYGNLFLINQREIYTLKTIKKNLKYKLEYLINYKKLLAEMNILY